MTAVGIAPQRAAGARRWSPAEREGRRRGAGALALLAGLAVPLPFLLAPADRRPPQPPVATVTLLRLLPPSPPVAVPAPARVPAPAPAVAASPPSVPATPPAVRPPPDRSITWQPPAAPAEADQSSAPRTEPERQTAAPPSSGTAPTLRLDDTVMRIAARDALLQREDPAFVGSEALSPSERLGREIERNTRPDCLRPGESLLSLPRVLFEALTDRCN
jgi:hypothetical protein